VSLGEVISSQKIVKKLLEDNKVILSVSTPTGLREAKKIYGQNLLVVYAPWDFSIFVKSFLNKFRPKALILFETEIWPSMIHACWKNNIPVILSNARLSESSYKKYEFINVFINSTLNKLSLILAQSHEHASRFKALGSIMILFLRLDQQNLILKVIMNLQHQMLICVMILFLLLALTRGRMS
jgi:3-deoxy-D-manno-octulosonic-acid transferase